MQIQFLKLLLASVFFLTSFSPSATACTLDLLNSLGLNNLRSIVNEHAGLYRLEKYQRVQKYFNDIEAMIPLTTQSTRDRLDDLPLGQKFNRLDYQIMAGGDAAKRIAGSINALVWSIEQKPFEEPIYFTLGNITREAALLADFIDDLVDTNHGLYLTRLAEHGLLELPPNFQSYQKGCKALGATFSPILRNLTFEIHLNIQALNKSSFPLLSETQMRTFASK